MKYRATKPGFVNSRLQKVGDVFDAPKGFKAAWAEEVVEVEKPKVEKPKEPSSRKKTKVSKKTSKGKR